MSWNYVTVTIGDDPPRRVFFPDFAQANGGDVAVDVIDQIRARGFATLEGGAGPAVHITPAAGYVKAPPAYIAEEMRSLLHAMDCMRAESATLEREEVKGADWRRRAELNRRRFYSLHSQYVELQDRYC